MNKTHFEWLEHLVIEGLQQLWNNIRSAQALKGSPGWELSLNHSVSFTGIHGSWCYDRVYSRSRTLKTTYINTSSLPPSQNL